MNSAKAIRPKERSLHVTEKLGEEEGEGGK